MRPLPAPTRRLAFRSLVVLALLVTVVAGSLAFLPIGPEPHGPIAAAAPPSQTAPASQPTPPPLSGPPSDPPSEPPSSAAAPGPSSSLGPSRPTSQIVPPPPSATEATRQALTAQLGKLRATYGMPGVSAAILFPDGTMWRATSGFADVRTKRRLTADTEFAVASISKTFVAALILRLAEEGRVDLDSPAITYRPDLAIDPAITIRQLLDHTSGLHDYFYGEGIDEALLADRRRAWTADEMLAYVEKPYFAPGTGWHYSNTNYLVLGLVAETVGGASVAEQLRTRFLGPLGLVRSHYQAVEKPRGPMARAYRFDGPSVRLRPIPLSDGTAVVPFTSVVTAAGSAGSIASTPTDLVRWARALYGGDVLAPTSLTAMITDALSTARFKPSIPYGLGVQEATIDGRPTLGHSGRLLGSRSVVRWLPNEGIAIAVLTNQSRYDPGVIARALLRVVLGTPVVTPTPTPTPLPVPTPTPLPTPAVPAASVAP